MTIVKKVYLPTYQPTYDALYLFVTMLNYYGLLVFLVGNGTYQSDGN